MLVYFIWVILYLGTIAQAVASHHYTDKSALCSIPRLVPLGFQSACFVNEQEMYDLGDGDDAHVEELSQAGAFVSTALLTGQALDWVNEPICLYTNSLAMPFCSYTSSKFSRGRGISFIGTPQQIRKATEIPLFKSPSYFDRDDDDTGTQQRQKFEHRPIHGRGNSVVATNSLFPGDRVYSFKPILAVHNEVMQAIDNSTELSFLLRVAVNRLPAASRALFASMHAHFGDDPHYDRLNTNAFTTPIGNSQGHFWGPFPENARLNHNCRPNTAYYLDPVTLEQSLQITRRVTPGEELTISYISPYLKWSDRQQHIQAQWGFACTCSHCSAPSIHTKTSDHRLEAIIALEEQLDDVYEQRTATLASAETLVSLCEQERLDAGLAMGYTYVALEATYAANRLGAIKWVNKALEAQLIWRGLRHPYTEKMVDILDDVEQLQEWNWTAKMRTASVRRM